MTLRLRDDGERIGHAILELGSPRTMPLSVSLQFPDRTFLGADGRRGRGRHLFSAESLVEGGRQVRLGPEVTAHVHEAEIVTFADAEGTVLGTASWDGIRVPLETGDSGLRLAGGRRPMPVSARGGAPTLPLAHEPSPLPGTVSGSKEPAPPPLAATDHAPAPRIRRRVALLLVIALVAALAAMALLLTQRRAAPPPPLPAPALAARPAAPSVDDALCDQLAGNRFDPDHPAGRPAQDEIFDLALPQSAAGLAACDPRPDRAGSDRRFLVQRGRLLAERSLRRLAAGDMDGATTDMDAALAAWRRGDALGSAYAANLLGAYFKGTFNRPARTFVVPDDAAAARHWQNGMRRGSAVAERNFAAVLMMGHGVPADPIRALDLLRDALTRGDPRAAGVLGVALYTGAPPGVALDKAAGWPLVVGAQCVDRDARALVEQEIARGTHSAADRRRCR